MTTNTNDEAKFSDGKHTWLVRDLWAHAPRCHFERVHPASIGGADKLLSSCVWSHDGKALTVQEVLDHASRVQSANVYTPILLTPDGVVADGVHGLIKALRMGMSQILVVRLTSMPEPYHPPTAAETALAAIRGILPGFLAADVTEPLHVLLEMALLYAECEKLEGECDELNGLGIGSRELSEIAEDQRFVAGRIQLLLPKLMEIGVGSSIPGYFELWKASGRGVPPTPEKE